MITINTERAELKAQLQDVVNQMNVLNESYQQLSEQLRQSPDWAEETEFRLVLSDAAVMKIMAANKALIDYIYSAPDIIAQIDNGTTYIYLDYLLPDDEAIILSSGGIIELKPEPEVLPEGGENE